MNKDVLDILVVGRRREHAIIRKLKKARAAASFTALRERRYITRCGML